MRNTEGTKKPLVTNKINKIFTYKNISDNIETIITDKGVVNETISKIR